MSPSARKLLGLVVLLAGLGVYALLAMRLAVAVLPENLIVQTLFYLVAGTAWVLPARPLVRWMQSGDAKS